MLFIALLFVTLVRALTSGEKSLALFEERLHARALSHLADLASERNPVTGDITCGTSQVASLQSAAFADINQQLFGKAPPQSPCFESKCDDPAVRDATSVAPRKLHVVFTVWNNVMNAADLTNTINEFVNKMALVNISVQAQHRFVTDKQFGQCLSAYDGTMDWYYDLMELKKQHAVDVGRALNVFVGCQTKGPDGTLLGIATFPWDPLALTGYGGLWMNVAAMDPADTTLLHETGHCLGLWHTFHGVDEVANCEPGAAVCALHCCERPHARVEGSTAPSNREGDLCSDTSAAPRSWHCASPSGKACDGQAWGATDFHNIMGYAMLNPVTNQPENCQSGFSTQQTSRMHCYLQDELRHWT